jgi:plasmid stabilization system protein ParE
MPRDAEAILDWAADAPVRAASYRDRAAHLRRLAANTHTGDARESLLDLARQFEVLAERVERWR